MRPPASAILLTAAIAAATVVIPLAAAADTGATRKPWRTVTYQGVSIRVPQAWPVVDLTAHPKACPRLDTHAVYLGTPGPDPACPPGLTGRADAVMMTPLRPGDPAILAATAHRPGPQPIYTNPARTAGRAITDILPTAGLAVSFYYKDSAATARAIEATITITGPVKNSNFARLNPAASRPPKASQSQGVYQGPGFDACAAPPLSTMTAWLASKYRAIGVYIGGVNRGCPQAYLTAAYLSAIQSQGWHYFPIYVGLQSACVMAYGNASITSAQAAAQGKAAADDAAAQAGNLGIPKATPLIFDMEAYAPSCDGQVTTFLGAWDAELRAQGYAAGVYESFTNIGALVAASGRITEPDLIYYADWDGKATTASSYMPAGQWTGHQRIHQYSGGHNETYGGVAINIDADQLDVNLGGGGSVPPPSPQATHAAFRIAVAMNTNGTAEWFARTAAGQIAHSWQAPLGTVTWATARPVGRSPAGLVSNPATASQANGVLNLFARAGDGRLQHAWQQAGAPNGWRWGPPLAAVPGGALPGTDPGAARMPNRQIAVFQTTSAGTVMMNHQVHAGNNSRWSGWTNLGGTCSSTPVPFADASGKLDVFCVSVAGTASLDTWNGHSWSGWSFALNIPHNLTGVPAVVTNAAGQTEFFAITGDGSFDYAWQNPANGNWTWKIGVGGTAAGLTGSPSAAAWPGGQIAVYAQVAGGQPAVLVQAGSGGGQAPFGNWATIGGAASGVLGSPAAWLNSNGTPGVAALDGNLQLAVANAPGGAWTPWTELLGGL